MTDETQIESVTLCHDMECVLTEYHRERSGDGVFLPHIGKADLTALAAQLARRLGPLIGGRYIPKRDDRAVRDAGVWQAFTGRNHKEVMAQFAISRRLLYSILARRRRGGV